jgi:hypothetical protein
VLKGLKFMSKKTISFVLIFIATLLSFFWVQQGRVASISEGDTVEVLSKATTFSVDSSSMPNKEVDASEVKKNQEEAPDQASLFSPIEVAEQQEWLRSRGNFFGVRGNEYDSYDFATLHQLADSGDLHAMHKLAHLYISDLYYKQYGFKAAEDMLMRAALYGSSFALAEIADIKHSQRLGAASELDKRHLVVVSLAYFRAAELRGDYWGSITMRDPLLNINPIVLEPEEKESIESFAQSVYTQLEAQRESTGLGVFDNSVPESVAKLFKELKEQQPYGK